MRTFRSAVSGLCVVRTFRSAVSGEPRRARRARRKAVAGRHRLLPPGSGAGTQRLRFVRLSVSRRSSAGITLGHTWHASPWVVRSARITGQQIAAIRTCGAELVSRTRPPSHGLAAADAVRPPPMRATRSYRAAAACERADARRGRKSSGAIPHVDFGLRDPWRSNQLERCRP